MSFFLHFFLLPLSLCGVAVIIISLRLLMPSAPQRLRQSRKGFARWGSLKHSTETKVENCVENSINEGIIKSLDVITESAEGILDEIAELKAFISEQQRKSANKCSTISFYEGLEEINKNRKKHGKPPIKPIIVD